MSTTRVIRVELTQDHLDLIDRLRARYTNACEELEAAYYEESVTGAPIRARLYELREDTGLEYLDALDELLFPPTKES